MKLRSALLVLALAFPASAFPQAAPPEPRTAHEDTLLRVGARDGAAAAARVGVRREGGRSLIRGLVAGLIVPAALVGLGLEPLPALAAAGTVSLVGGGLTSARRGVELPAAVRPAIPAVCPAVHGGP